MLIELDVTFEKLESKGASRRSNTVRKMVAQLAKKGGADKWTTRFLAKVACLLNSRSEGANLKTRAKDVLIWTCQNEDILCSRLTWTKQNFLMAQGIIAYAAGFCGAENTSPICVTNFIGGFGREERAQTEELGRVLGYVEMVAEYTTIWRRRNTKPSLRTVGRVHNFEDAKKETWDEELSLDKLQRETSLYNSLSPTFRKQLERTARAA